VDAGVPVTAEEIRPPSPVAPLPVAPTTAPRRRPSKPFLSQRSRSLDSLKKAAFVNGGGGGLLGLGATSSAQPDLTCATLELDFPSPPLDLQPGLMDFFPAEMAPPPPLKEPCSPRKPRQTVQRSVSSLNNLRWEQSYL